MPHREITLFCKIAPTVFDDGRKGVTVVFEDISEQRRTEDALRESEERYRSFVQNFHGIAFWGKMDFIPFFFHGAGEEITGYTEQEFVAGSPRWDEIIHREDSIELEKSIRDIHTIPNYSSDRDYRIVRRDGQLRWIHEHIRNICDKKGQPAFFQGARYDITDRKIAEEALHESEATARALINESMNRRIPSF